MKLNNKIAIVTGGADGIGKATAIRFAQEGAVVVIWDLNEEKGNETVQQIESAGGKASFAKVNTAVYAELEAATKQVVDQFGTLDIIINNAGITRDNLMLRMSKDDWDTIIKVNLDSVFNLTKAVIKPMMKARAGSIINMTSVVGVKGNAGQANYAASKAGVIGFSKSIALELGSRNIRCNAIAPGFIETEMTAALDEKTVQGWRDSIPLKRGGQPEDVANACVFLASDLSSYITGQVLNVDGGMLT